MRAGSAGAILTLPSAGRTNEWTNILSDFDRLTFISRFEFITGIMKNAGVEYYI
jgi:hypothetical protein